MTWPRVQLKQVASVSVSAVDKKSSQNERAVRLCNYVDVYKNDLIDASLDFMQATASPSQIRSFGLRAGDTVITKDSETADDIAVPAYIVETIEGLVCGYHLAVVRPGPRLDAKYLFWCLASQPMREQAAVAATGVTRFGLRQQSIRNTFLSLPSLSEQRRIADFLDRETARVDDLLIQRRRLLVFAQERLVAYREAVLAQHPEVRWTPLQHLTNPQRPIVYGIVQAGEEVPGGVPYIKTGDLAPLAPETLSRTSAEIDRAYRRARVHPGDIVIAMRASIGLAVVVPSDLPVANLTQGTARIAPGKNISTDWLFQTLACQSVQEECKVRAVGTTFKTLNIWDLRRISIPVLPSQKLRQRATKDVVREADRVEGLASVMESQADRLLERRMALITAAVSGQLDVTTARGVA